jgi:tetratricopeptide (TPR) repeat protein
MPKMLFILLLGRFDVLQAGEPSFTRAMELKSQGRWNDALEIMHSLLAADSNNLTYLQQTAFLLLKTGFLSGEITIKKKHYRQAEYLTRKAIRLDPENITSHFYYLAALGRITEISSDMEKVQLVRKIRRECEFILARDSTHAATWHVLGRWHREIASLSTLQRWMLQQLIGKVKGGTFEDALYCFYRAIRHAPSDLSHYYETAVTLSLRNHPSDRAQAVQWLKRGLALPLKPENPEERFFRLEMEKLLGQIQP